MAEPDLRLVAEFYRQAARNYRSAFRWMLAAWLLAEAAFAWRYFGG